MEQMLLLQGRGLGGIGEGRGLGGLGGLAPRQQATHDHGPNGLPNGLPSGLTNGSTTLGGGSNPGHVRSLHNSLHIGGRSESILLSVDTSPPKVRHKVSQRLKVRVNGSN
jgi:hypothetical protein